MSGGRDLRVEGLSGRSSSGDPQRLRHDAHAVVIGINTYTDPKIPNLRYARADAEAVYQVLTDPELGRFPRDNVILLLDDHATGLDIKVALSHTLPSRAGENDMVCVYYAGHGAPVIDPRARSQDGLEKYLVPADAKLDHLRASGISMDDVLKYFGWIHSKQILFFIDSCYSGEAGGRTFSNPEYQARAALTSEFLDRLGGEGRLIMTACDVNEVSLELPEVGHGLFTHHLLRGLGGAADANADGLVSIHELYEYVADHVTEDARRLGGSMRPVQKGSVSGRIALTQYETAAQREGRELHAEAQQLFGAGAPGRAQKLWERALALVPEHEGALEGLRALEQRRVEAERWRKRKQRALYQLHVKHGLPLPEYDRAVKLLNAQDEELVTEEREARRWVDLLAEGKVSVVAYASSIEALLASPESQRPSGPTGTHEAALRTGGDQAASGEREPGRHQERVKTRDRSPAASKAHGGGAAAFRDCADCPELIVIPAGNFVMGSPPDEVGRLDNEGPQHSVSIARPFALGRYQVTRAEFAVFARETRFVWPEAWFPQTDRHPAVNVSWADAQRYVRWLSQRTSHDYRLPSEAEWEYGARGGTTTARFWGRGAGPIREYANVSDASVHTGERPVATTPVGTFRPNSFGLYDMLGNVWEWVQDCWHDSYTDSPQDGSAWMTGHCTLRVVRGGSWSTIPANVRSAFRFGFAPTERDTSLGFRVARTLT